MFGKERVEGIQGSSKTGMFLSSVQGRIHRVSLTALNPFRNSKRVSSKP